MGIMNDFCIDMMDRLASEAKQEMLISGGGKTMKEWHFNTATKLILPGELKKHGVGEGTKESKREGPFRVYVPGIPLRHVFTVNNMLMHSYRIRLLARPCH